MLGRAGDQTAVGGDDDVGDRPVLDGGERAVACERPDGGARGQPGQPRRLLLVGAGQPDRLGGEHGAAPRPRRHPRAQRPRDDLGLDQAEPEPLELLGHGDGEPALLARGLPQRGRVAVAVGVLDDPADGGQVEALGEVAAHGGAELLLVFGECEEHPGPYRGRPSTRSAVTLRWTWLEPPQIVTDRDHMDCACSGRRSTPPDSVETRSSVAASPSRSS